MTDDTQKIVEQIVAGKDWRGYMKNGAPALDNHNQPKINYLGKLVEKSDKELEAECEQMIWLSAYANNNPRSDYHWQCDACYDECDRRGNTKIYSRAHKTVSAGAV